MQLPAPEHDDADPVPADQFEKDEPASGVAVKVTTVTALKVSEQSAPQFIPDAVTAPVPVPDFVMFKTYSVSNVAVIGVSLSIVMLQVPVPLQPPPLQPVKIEPALGVAVRVIVAPVAYISPQSVPQLIPPGLLMTVPDPAPDLDMESKY